MKYEIYFLLQMTFLYTIYSHFDAHTAISFADTFAENRFPSTTFALSDKAFIFFTVSPISLPPDVAKGTTVLPLKSYANIIKGNALTINWEEVVSKEKIDYIMGNPPFIGAKIMEEQQKKDAINVFGKIKLANSLDYVCAWYFKACEMLYNTKIRCAFVSTNSICQGEQATAMWKPLVSKYNIEIDFAYKTFVWNNETKNQAKVHCVIVGFSHMGVKNKIIFDNGKSIFINEINQYLLNAPIIFVEKHNEPICNIPKISFGNMPVDGGNFIFTNEEKEKFVKKEPMSEKYFKKYIGAVEFLNQNYRWCLWLKDILPSELRKMPSVMNKVQAVREFRLQSSAKPTRDKADTPTKFFFISQPDTDYLVVPKTSSGKRKYIPMGFVDKNTIASDLLSIIPNANLYIFGILSSNVHNSWVRLVSGRLKSDYRYTGSIVYNTFPFCNPTEEQKKKIEKTAKSILNARQLYPDSSLADLYNDILMPSELRKAHQENDRAVMEAYGFPVKNTFTESMCVAELMKMYEKIKNS